MRLRLLGSRWFDLIRLESSIAKCVTLVDRLSLLAVLDVAKILALTIQRNVFISKGGFFPAMNSLKALKAIIGCRYKKVVDLARVITSVLVKQLVHVSLSRILSATDGAFNL